jgi:cytoskeletal protein CcmA (bactofilin family)
MFGSKKTESKPADTALSNAKTTVSDSTNALNSLVKGTTVEGTIYSESDIRIDGTIKGNLTCKAKVIIGPTGVIDGEVKCQNAMIEGKMYGKLRVAELLSVKETAEIVGDVVTGKLLVQPGAIFNVTCNMRDGADKRDITDNNGHSKQPKKEIEVVVNGKN